MQLGFVRVFPPWFESISVLLFRLHLKFFSMAPGLPANRKARSSVLPVLPDPARLFKTRASKKAESTPKEFDGAGDIGEAAGPSSQTATTEVSSEVSTEKENFSNTDFVEDKTVSASTGERNLPVLEASPLTHYFSLASQHSIRLYSCHPGACCRCLELSSRPWQRSGCRKG